jgi:hypothetical protein
LNDLKRRVVEGVEARRDPADLEIPMGRFARTAIRVSLRQLQALAGSSPNLEEWKRIYDRSAEPADDDERAQHG